MGVVMEVVVVVVFITVAVVMVMLVAGEAVIMMVLIWSIHLDLAEFSRFLSLVMLEIKEDIAIH